MRYEKARDLKESDFKRLCGVKKEAFVTMCEVVKEVLSRETRGRKSGLSAEDQVLLTLGYWREYERCFIWGRISAYTNQMFRALFRRSKTF